MAEASYNVQLDHEFKIPGYGNQVSISGFAEFGVLEFTFFEKSSNPLDGFGFRQRFSHEISFRVESLPQIFSAAGQQGDLIRAFLRARLLDRVCTIATASAISTAPESDTTIFLNMIFIIVSF